MSRNIFVVVLGALLLHLAAPALAQVSTYTDETAYLNDLGTLGFSAFQEGFEDDAAWGSARSPSTAPGVTNQGILWGANNLTSQITTGGGPARTGSWGFYSLPHGDYDQHNPPTKDCTIPGTCGDGFGGTSTGLLYGVGGWFESNTPGGRVQLSIDGVPIDFGAACDPDNCALGSAHRFFGVIDTNGFTSFVFDETEGTLGDQKLVFADDFSFGTLTLAVCGNGTVEAGEQCDDGNTNDGDCCSSTCQREPAGTICRPALDPGCDVAESCDGIGDSCPADVIVGDGTVCSIADACNGDGFCASGVCSAPAAISCDDGDVCTTDSCDPVTGCTNLFVPGPACSEQSTDQQRCINLMNLKGYLVAKMQGSVSKKCITDTAHARVDKLGIPPQSQTAQACLTNDVNDRIDKKIQKLIEKELTLCLADPAQLPGYGYTDSTNISDAARSESRLLIEDLFGASLDASVLLTSDDRLGARCQLEVMKRSHQLFEHLWKQALKAKKNGLKGKDRLSGTDPVAPIKSIAELEAEILAFLDQDPRERVAKAVLKLEDRTVLKCSDPGVLTSLFDMFPGVCAAAANPGDLATCATERARCRFCLSLNQFDGLAIDCNGFFDGDEANNDSLSVSCP